MWVEPFWGRRTRGVSLGRGVGKADVPAGKSNFEIKCEKLLVSLVASLHSA